jgi:PTS system N-acetylgalactosamine-specific IIA component
MNSGAEMDGPVEQARALVAGHGDYAAGMISAVAQITGRGALFSALSNRDLGADELTNRMREIVDTGATVIFTDLPAGSSTIAARRLLRERPDVRLVTGANLAALLDFVFHGEAPDAEALERAAEKGRASITVVGAHG